MGKDKFVLKSPILSPNLLKIYINLELVIAKLLRITFSVTIFLLNHINVAFQSTSYNKI